MVYKSNRTGSNDLLNTLDMLTQLAHNNTMQSWTPDKIKTLREKYKLSQRAFGELLGVTRMHIYYIERGKKTPSKTLQLLMDCVEEKIKKKGGK